MATASRVVPKPSAEQPSLDDDARARRDERIVKRLEQMANVVADLEGRLPAWRREIEALLREFRG